MVSPHSCPNLWFPMQTLLQSCLPYPEEVRMVREAVGGGNIAIAGAQNPHKQLRILHLPEAHFQLSAGMVMESHIREHRHKWRARALAHN